MNWYRIVNDALKPEDVCEVTCASLLKALSVQQSDSMALVVIKKRTDSPSNTNYGGY